MRELPKEGAEAAKAAHIAGYGPVEVAMAAAPSVRKQALEEIAEEIEAMRGHTPIDQAAELCRRRLETYDD